MKRLALLLVLLACDKPTTDKPTEITPTRDPAPVASSVTITEPPPPASAPVFVAPAASSAPEIAKAGRTADARKPTPAVASTAPPAPAPEKTVTGRVTGHHFALNLAATGCHAATECAMTITLVASGDFHVNKEYPYKFTASPAPNVTFLGKGDATTFSRAAGDFVEQGEKTATMTVRFKPGAAGDASLSGLYKFSVCSADQCQVEQQKLDLVVPVL